MTKVTKYTIHTFILLISMIGICFLLSVIPNFIPGNYIKENLSKSIETIISDDSKHPFGNIYFFKLDNFTDALMLNMTYNVDSDTPVKSAMENKYIINDNGDIIKTTKNILSNDYTDTETVNYSRYWHGNQLFLRPLLVFTDYNGIRIINYICLSFLFMYLCFLLFKMREMYILFSICISAIIFNLWIVPLSMQFSCTFYIALSASILLLSNTNKRNNKQNNISLYYMVIGGATSYFDLLSTPLITLGLPLIIYISLIDKNIKYRIHLIIICSLTWLLGYSIIWICKWLMAHFIIGYDINDAIYSVIFRASTEYNDFDMSFKGIFDFMINHAPTALFVAILLALVFIIFNFIIYYKRKRIFIENIYLLLIASIPFIWCLVIRNHSIIHCSFVWRIFFISMVAYVLFIANIYKSKYKNEKSRTYSMLQ